MAKGDPKKGQAMLDRMSSGVEFDELDLTPIEMPFDACKPATLQEMVARYVRQAVSLERDEEFETPEEADDFEPEDEMTLDFSPYEFDELNDGLGSAVVEDPPPEEDSPSVEPPTGDDPDPNDPEPG